MTAPLYLHTAMRARVGIIVGVVLLGVAIFGTRYYEIDRPLWQYFAGESAAVDPLTLHLKGEFVESNLGVPRKRTSPSRSG